jgi:SAM-dependent methyltransferase
MELLQINPYNEEAFKSQDNSWFLDNANDYDHIIWEKYGTPCNMHITPRETLHTKIFSAVPFYYLQFLKDITPLYIIDIGCGSNWLKPFFPGLVGFDPKMKAADVNVFYGTNLDVNDKYDAVIAMNSMHFAGIDKFNDQLSTIIRLLRPGGRAYFTANIDILMKNTGNFNRNTAILYCDKIIRELPALPLVVDQVYNQDFDGNRFEGNIRIVFEKR